MSNLFEIIPNITLIDSPPRSGKSCLVKYILYDLFKNNKLKYGIVFCGTSFTGCYDFLPKKYVYGTYDENALINLINLQIIQIKNHGKASPAFIIWDDCLGQVDFMSPVLKKLFTTYRHYNLQLIFTTQYIYAVSPILRQCSSYFITFRQQQKRSLQAIYETFLIDFDSYDECKQFISDNCIDYHFLLVKTLERDEKRYIISRCPLIENINIKY